MKKKTPTSFALDEDTKKDLAYIASTLGITLSAALTILIREKARQLRADYSSSSRNSGGR